jgi:2-polyprenyl-3-methyl-5-hydroxy-6-metoxy-1,4-benzoquinol methylase
MCGLTRGGQRHLSTVITSEALAQVIVEQFGADKVIATDVNPEQIWRAEKILRPELEGKTDFKIEDALALDEPDGKLDAVFSFGVIHHMEDWKKAVRCIHLKSGGEFFFGGTVQAAHAAYSHEIFAAPPPEGGEFDFDELKQELERNGIAIMKKLSAG